MECAFLLNIVVCESAFILELLSRKYKPLLVGRDALLILNLSFHCADRVAAVDIECDGFTSEGLDEYLHISFTV